MSSENVKTVADPLDVWQGANVNYNLLDSLLGKVIQQMFAVGLDNSFLHHIATSGSDPSDPEDDCFPFIERGFKVSETGLRFECYLGVDVENKQTKTDRDNIKNRAREVYRSLLMRRQRPATHLQPDQEQNIAEVSTITLPKTASWVQEMAIVELPAVKQRSCDYCLLETIEIPVPEATVFFNAIVAHAFALHVLHRQQISKTEKRIALFGSSLIKVTTPSRLCNNKSDLDVWRTILKLFLDFDIFNAKSGRTAVSPENFTAVQRVRELQSDVSNKGLSKSFRRKESPSLLTEFFGMIINSLQFASFFNYHTQTIMQLLGEFDSKTIMTIQLPFLRFLRLDYISNSVQPYLATINTLFSSEIVRTVPMLEDYTCPVCGDIAFTPIRLVCRHLFCIRCMVKLQRRRTTCCPICRQATVMSTDSSHIDHDLLRFLKTFFPTEVKQKQRSNQEEVFVEQRSRVLRS